MTFKVAVLLATVLAISLAVPTPRHEFSDFFIHADPNARIVGGSQAAEGSVPYMVAMSNGLLVRSFLCGGSLISARHVLTAAHCIDAVYSSGALSRYLRVTVGTNRWNSGGQSYNLSRNVTHPNYVSTTIKNDIGILVTSTNVVFSNLVQPVVLSYNHIGAGVRSKAAGWGRTRVTVPTPRHEFSDFFIHADPNARIVGGSQAAEGSVPYMVAMSNGLLVRSFLCGGSLISARHVLTAAHCIEAVFSRGALSSSLRVTVGTNRWNSGGQSYSLSRNVTHPNYVSATIKNDIGILVTSSNVAFSNLVQPVVLSYDYIGAGVRSKAAGWGRIRQNGALSPTLLQLIVTTIDGQQCVREVAQRATELNIRAPAVEPHIELCVYHSPGHGMCNGDSGSALVIESSSLQIGIVSWGIPCARGAPDILLCGGSLISARHVLTAAHCIDAVYSSGALSRYLRVTVGTNRWNSGGQSYNLSKAAGWGRTRQSGSMSAALQRLIVTTIDGQQCVRDVGQRAAELNLRAPPVEPHIELCVYHSPGHGMCNGDSGSALVIESSSLQIGIVSWGLPCARGAPDMFVRVSAYRDWITRAMA
ncbi:Chymotrypsin-2 [Papilio machaon]|uniref:Chymotrypsin-2 n=1 Tax=Papilio machaon TaxID=76193 RepID=A0A0N1PHG9_PAPMA|nr:Chymotrypsin-2 [Papilio machaon]